MDWKLGIRGAKQLLTSTFQKKILVTRDDPKPKSIENITFKDGVTALFTVQYAMLHILSRSFHELQVPIRSLQSLPAPQRRVVSPAFSIKYLNSLEPLFKSCTQVFARKIYEAIRESERTGKPAVVDVYLMLQNLALVGSQGEKRGDIIGETAYGQTLDMVENGKHPLPKIMYDEITRILWIFSGSLQRNFGLLSFFVPKFINPYIISFTDRMIKQRQDSGKRRADILQYLLDTQGVDATETMRGLNMDDIRMEAAFLLFAGSETTANSTTFAVILLLQHPECVERLRRELDNALGCPDEGAPLADQEVLKGLPYLNACIWESFRLVEGKAGGVEGWIGRRWRDDTRCSVVLILFVCVIRMKPISEGVQRITSEDVQIGKQSSHLSFHPFLAQTTLIPILSPLTSSQPGQYAVPNGTLVNAFNHGLHYSPDHWTSPTTYTPDRFIDASGTFVVPSDLLYPFSGGSRNCIGKKCVSPSHLRFYIPHAHHLTLHSHSFGLMEMRLTIAMLFHRFDLAMIPGESDERANSPSGMRLKHEHYHVKMTRRGVA
ncbi:cytochrome P450 [Jimgerdemannia flammicorona]|uniref:Cytochrome P450 n=1 Tax=Jimgerdemannia flammicorona TaxID=994334 RepID=A0A433D7Z1_9FUNG|nr:cytochrome P450 [Jimgerdemannia flammicorona]